jgi:hypothetical protein
MMILVSKTYEEARYDDDGETTFEDDGFEFVDEPLSFRELVRELTVEGHRYPSCWPPTGSRFEWVETAQDMDMEGLCRHTALHFSMKNPERKDKYWRWAMIHAGLIKVARP